MLRVIEPVLRPVLRSVIGARRSGGAPLPAPTTINLTSAQYVVGLVGSTSTTKNAARVYGRAAMTIWSGVITGAGDNSTSAQRLVPDFFKDLSLADLQMLQDPWGRRYLMIAQQFGSLWGLS